MGTAAIAAAAAILGALANGLLTLIPAARADRQNTRTQQRDALQALLAALVDHRRHQYLKIAARRDGDPDTPETRAARYEARSAVTRALDQLALTIPNPAIRAAADKAVAATFALGDATTDQAIADAGQTARQAHDALRNTAARHLHH